MEKASYLLAKVSSSICSHNHIPAPLACAQALLLQGLCFPCIVSFICISLPWRTPSAVKYAPEHPLLGWGRRFLMTQWNSTLASLFSSFSAKFLTILDLLNPLQTGFLPHHFPEATLS